LKVLKADIAGSVKVLENLYRDEPSNSMAECGFKSWRERFTWGGSPWLRKPYGSGWD
jgi:hypothetical protein